MKELLFDFIPLLFLFLITITPSLITILCWYFRLQSWSLLIYANMLYHIFIPLQFAQLKDDLEDQLYNSNQKLHSFKNGIFYFCALFIITSQILYFSLQYLNIWNVDMVKYIIPNPILYCFAISFYILFYSFSEELFWRCFMKICQDELNSEIANIFIALQYGLLYACYFSALFKTLQIALTASLAFVLIGRIFQNIYQEKGLISCILANFGIKLPLTIFIMSWFQEDGLLMKYQVF